MITDTRRPATDKQFSFLKALIAERELDANLTDWVSDSRTRAMNGKMTSLEASKLIDALLDAPKKQEPVAAPAEEIEAGIYKSGGRLFRVYLGQKVGRMLVKEVFVEDHHDVHYEYLGAAARQLPTDAERLALEEVGSLGVASGTCLCCGRRLNDPESVDRGIGPICAANY